jgi:argininosuccinate lyase
MRERIKAELSEVLQKNILLPAMVAEFEVGFEDMVTLNKAYAIMLAEEKIIDQKTAGRLLQALKKVHRELTVSELSGKYEELYFNFEHALFEIVGREIGGRLHTGRSRNDIYATLARMEIRKSLWEVCKKNLELQELLLAQARDHLETVITGYTHTQPAQPITYGHYCTAAVQALGRDFDRMKSAYHTINACPYGAAALAGTAFPINRQRLSELLGFDRIMKNTLDCVGARDYVLEAEAAFAIMMITISRIAQDLYIWSTEEFGLLDVGGEIAISSSIMPQKKNPISLELAKAKAAHSLGSFVSSAAVLRNTPFSLCMDLFEVLTPYWEGRRHTLQSLMLIIETLKYSKIRKERAIERAKLNFSTVTALADVLVQKCGISFSEAHSIVGEMVGKVIDTGIGMMGIKSSLLQSTSSKILKRELVLSEDEIQKAIDPYENVISKNIVGGPNPNRVQEMINEAQSELRINSEWLEREIYHVEQVNKKLAELEAEYLISL